MDFDISKLGRRVNLKITHVSYPMHTLLTHPVDENKKGLSNPLFVVQTELHKEKYFSIRKCCLSSLYFRNTKTPTKTPTRSENCAASLFISEEQTTSMCLLSVRKSLVCLKGT